MPLENEAPAESNPTDTAKELISGQPRGNEGSTPSGLTKDEVNSLIEQALSQRINPLQKNIRQLSEERTQKVAPIVDENRSLTEQLKALRTERDAEKAQNRDIEITGQLERTLLAKGIPEDSIDMAVSYIKNSYGTRLSVDTKRKLVYTDEYGEPKSLNSFSDDLMKLPALGRLLPPVDAPSARGLRGNNSPAGRKPRYDELSKVDQNKMTTKEVSQYVRDNG